MCVYIYIYIFYIIYMYIYIYIYIYIYMYVFIPIPLPENVTQTTSSTMLLYEAVIQAVLGMGMGMKNVTSPSWDFRSTEKGEPRESLTPVLNACLFGA